MDQHLNINASHVNNDQDQMDQSRKVDGVIIIIGQAIMLYINVLEET